MKPSGFYFFPRCASDKHPAGVTVSKKRQLPQGGITEYTWGTTSLWFVDADEFTADEREAAYRSVIM